MIKDVPKTLVYRLCRYRNARAGRPSIPEAVLTKAPSAELRPDQRDDQSLPAYEILDPVLDALVSHDRSVADVAGSGFDPELVARVARLVDGAEYKRRQSPPGVRITAKAFGKDRRMPITNRYRDHAPRRSPSALGPGDRGVRPVPDPFEAMTLAVGGPERRCWAPGRRLPFEAQARVVGSYQWIERRLFEVLGGWVSSEPVPEAQLLFDIYSQQHAWHAELCAERLPASISRPRQLRLAPSVEVDRLFGVLAGVRPITAAPADADRTRRGPESAVGRHAAAPGGQRPGGAPPAWSRGTACISDGSRPSADAPVVRCLRLVLRDEIGAVAGDRGPHPGAAAPPPRRRRGHRLISSASRR